MGSSLITVPSSSLQVELRLKDMTQPVDGVSEVSNVCSHDCFTWCGSAHSVKGGFQALGRRCSSSITGRVANEPEVQGQEIWNAVFRGSAKIGRLLRGVEARMSSVKLYS